MEWKDLQPIATIIAAIIGGVITAIVTLKLQNKKRNDDIDLKAFEHSLTKHLREFEQKLIGDNSYLAEKGKNIATKEDVDEITRKVESVRSEFAATTEVLRWQLSKKANLHKLQAEKEFEVYSKIWELATNLKFALEQLRPVVDFYDGSESAKERWARRYKHSIECGRNLLHEVEKQRPFYPNELFLQLQKILQKTNEEIVDFEFSLDPQMEKMSFEGYKKGWENLQEIVSNLNQICDLMRNRISESE